MSNYIEFHDEENDIVLHPRRSDSSLNSISNDSLGRNRSNSNIDSDVDMHSAESSFSDENDARSRLSSGTSSSTDAVDPCWICLSTVDDADRFRPCNCRFTFVHRECLKRWIGLSVHNQRCGLCKIRYDADRIDSHCSICQNPVLQTNVCNNRKRCCGSRRVLENSVIGVDFMDRGALRVCRCENLVLHGSCLHNVYDYGIRQCPYCRSDFDFQNNANNGNLLRRPLLSQRTTKCLRFVRCALFSLLSLCLFVFLIGGNMIIELCAEAAFNNAKEKDVARQYHVREFHVANGGSSLLFPGLAHHSITADVVFIALFMVLFVVGLLSAAGYAIVTASRLQNTATFDSFRRRRRFYRFCYCCCCCLFPTYRNNRCFYIVLAAALACLFTHLLGNLHYAFYYLVGVIPEINLFWLFDLRSFLAGSFVLIQCLFAFLTVVATIKAARICCRQRRPIQQQPIIV
jgi:hypothetical protein